MNQAIASSPKVFVIGNLKGGAGKTTCCMHLIASLMDKGYKVASIDTDSVQHSLTTYLGNRKKYNEKNPDHLVAEPLHFHLSESKETSLIAREQDEKAKFDEYIQNAKAAGVDYIVIDTPGAHSTLSKYAHSHADWIITPINDSMVDFDVLAKTDSSDLSIISPSVYSQMIWEQKMQRAARDRGSIEWIVMRNRLSNIDAINKRNVAQVLGDLAKRISFKIAPGFSERVIFRELFPHGLTLLDLNKANFGKNFSISHVAARQELRDFISNLGIE